MDYMKLYFTKKKLFAKTFNGLKTLTAFTKGSILDAWQNSEYLYVFHSRNVNFFSKGP